MPPSLILHHFILLIFGLTFTSSIQADEKRCAGLFSRLTQKILRQTAETIGKAVEPFDEDLIAVIASQPLTPENIELSRLKIQQIQNQSMFRPLSKTLYSELLGHTKFLVKAKKSQEKMPKEIRVGIRSSDPKIRAESFKDLLLLEGHKKIEILEELLEHPNRAVRRLGRQGLLSLGYRINYSKGMLEDLKEDLNEFNVFEHSEFWLELHSLNDSQFMSLEWKQSPLEHFLIGKSLDVWQQFEKKKGISPITIRRKWIEHQKQLTVIRELLRSDTPSVRARAVHLLGQVSYVTPEVLNLFHLIIEKEPVTEVKALAVTQLNYHDTIPSAYLSAGQTKVLKRNGDFALSRATEQIIQSLNPEEKKEDSSSTNLKWFQTAEEKGKGRVGRALDAYTFSRHVYSLPDAEKSRFLVASKPIDGKELAEQRIQWDKSVPVGYEVVETVSDPRTGLKAAVYREESKDHRYSKVYAFGGSQTAKDFWADLGLGRIQVDSPQFLRLVNEAAKDVENRIPILVTGHSLGGGLAQAFSYYVSKRAKELRKMEKGKNLSRGKDWDPNLYGEISVVSWMAIGGASIVRQDPNYSKDAVFEVKGLNNNKFKEGAEVVPIQIENYRLPGDPVSMVGDFLGDLLDIKGEKAFFPSIGKHLIASSINAGFVRNGVENAEPSRRIQIPNVLVNGISRNIGLMAQKSIDRDFGKNWRKYLAPLLEARLHWEKEQGYKRGLREVFSSGDMWLQREIQEILDFVPPDSMVEAGLWVNRTEDEVRKIRELKRRSPFK